MSPVPEQARADFSYFLTTRCIYDTIYEGLHFLNKERIMSAMAAAVPTDDELARKVDRLEERTALLRERFDDLRSEVRQGHESLRREMQLGFAAIDQRFVAIDQRFNSVEQRLGSLEKHAASVDQRFDAVDRRFDAMDQRLGALEKHAASVDRRFDAVEKRLDDQHALLLLFRDDLIRNHAALEARIDKSDAKFTVFFGSLLAAILAQIALQFLR